MDVFVWNMAISFQLLFVIISGVIFLYIGEKSFKFYALYCFFELVYLLSGTDFTYFGLKDYLSEFIGTGNSKTFFWIFDSYLQVIFYGIYAIFALYFIDLPAQNKIYFNKISRWIKSICILFLLLGIVCYLLKDADLYSSLFIMLYLPSLLLLFAFGISKAYRNAGKHKYFFLFGSFFFIGSALFAFLANTFSILNIDEPIIIFYLGVIIETVFFSLGLAYKIKLMNEEKNRVNILVTKHRHQREISKLQGLMEGEEKERKRIAEELHDGIAGDLSAIKMNLAYLNKLNKNEKNEVILDELTQIIDKSCQQIREISHNLSPSSITNYGILGATKNFCKKIKDFYKIEINFSFSGEEIKLSKTIETHIYRIIQELVNNVVKHSHAKSAQVTIDYDQPFIKVCVKDDGRGFSLNSISKGIGLSNIDSRIRFMNAEVKKHSSSEGTSFIILINLKEISEA